MDYLLLKDKENDALLLRMYLDEIGKYPVLDIYEETKLFLLYEQTHDCEIRDKICHSNLKLVVSVARKFLMNGVSLMELIQEGNIGLIKAIEKFDVSKGYRFSTYATFWIKQSIFYYIKDRNHGMKISNNVNIALTHYVRGKKELFEKLGREPNQKEILEYLSIPKETFMEFERILSENISLSYPIGDDETELLDYISSDENVEDIVLKVLDKEMLYCALNVLTEKEKYIVILRYGLYDNREYTLGEVANELYKLGLTDKVLSHERIRQILVNILDKLKKYYIKENFEASAKRFDRIKKRVEMIDKKIDSKISFLRYVNKKILFLKEDVERELSVLTPIQKQVILLRYGIYDGMIRTYDKVLEDLEKIQLVENSFSYGQVIFIEKAGLNSLKDSPLLPILESYYDFKLQNGQILKVDYKGGFIKK